MMGLKNLKTPMKKQPNKWLIFSSLAIQIAIVMYAMIQLGTFLDQKANPNENHFTLLTSVCGVITIVWLIYNQSKRFWEN